MRRRAAMRGWRMEPIFAMGRKINSRPHGRPGLMQAR
jgi:hypothetical protein